jgi:proteasome lid subunit RPN8/RPN11
LRIADFGLRIESPSQIRNPQSEIRNMTTELKITPEHDAAMRAHAARIYPHECCGFLLGRSLWEVGAVVPAANDRGEEERHNRFVITPEASLVAEKKAKALGLSVIGHYHSHPDCPARPSKGFDESDLESATWPGYAFVIVSVLKTQPVDVTAWNLREDRSDFDRVPILITDPQHTQEHRDVR